MLKLYNTLTKKIDDFEPLNPPKVTMYTCGPTVYNYPHIGNLRTMVMSDLLLRILQANDFEVKAVRNITDIEDKIIAKAKELEIPIEELTETYTKIFFEDLEKLNILPVSVNPKATEHIEAMVDFIQDLVNKGFAYVEKDGSVYFSISKFPEYGKLSRLDLREIKPGARVRTDEYSKEDVQDFALWKAVGADEVGFPSPWGRGRPGWHIECSVMSQKYLGDTIDIHAGGVDLIFPHHENEIAQSEAKTGKKFVNYFVHGEFILVNGAKMSKSLGNFYTLKDLEEKGFDPIALRYLFLTANYRDLLNFTWESLEAAQTALNRLREEIRAWEQPKEADDEIWQKFLEAANANLAIPQALALLWDLTRSDVATSSKSATLLKMDKILGLGLDKYLGKPLEIPEEVKKLVNERENARKSGDYEKSDEIRKEVKKLGFEILDTPEGPKLK